MKTLEAEFVWGAVKSDDFPKRNLPEIAFCGRSNVGKSSLLNSLVQRKNLAHISSTPGKTQQINFYIVENKWCFVDLPGFGYASVSKSKREDWAILNTDYLASRKELAMVCCLIDSRHDPMERDLALLEWLENQDRKYLIVLTKCDKISKTAVQERKEQLEMLTQSCSNCIEVLPYSSITNDGRVQLINIISKFAKL